MENFVRSVSVPLRKSAKNVRSGEDMMEVLADDVLRYELLSEQEQRAVEEECRGEAVEFPIEVGYDDSITVEINKENMNNDDVPEQNNRFVKITSEDCDQFLQDHVNKNTKYKTKSDLKIFEDWARENGEIRNIQDIPAEDLDSLLARMYLGNFLYF